MEEYWDMISEEYHQRLIALAEECGVDLNTALKSIVNCLQGETDSCFPDPITANQIEQMIDKLTI